MPSRKKRKDKGKGRQRKEMRQFANAAATKLIRGIHDGKAAAPLALMRHLVMNEREELFDDPRYDGITEALLKILQRCDESLASVFGDAHSNEVLAAGTAVLCLSTLLKGATQSHDTSTVCRKIAQGISPVIKCMIRERRVFFQSSKAWFASE